MVPLVAGLLGVGGVWLLWKRTLGAGPFKGAIVLEVQVRVVRCACSLYAVHCPL
jgi:hypothetical protein